MFNGKEIDQMREQIIDMRWRIEDLERLTKKLHRDNMCSKGAHSWEVGYRDNDRVIKCSDCGTIYEQLTSGDK